MHSAFNLLVFPNSMFTLLLFFYWKGYVLSGEIVLINNRYYYYYYEELGFNIGLSSYNECICTVLAPW